MFLITGCGRSGTKYIAVALQQCGLGVRHEQMGKDGIVSGYYCFDAQQYPGGRHPVPRPDFDVVLHQARHPLPTIASLQTTHSWKWACQFLPVTPNDPLLKRCCHHWLGYNEAAEKLAEYTYRIETLEEVWPTLQRLIGFDAPYSIVADLPKSINARKHDDVTWAEVRDAAPEIYDAILAASVRYGYSIEGAK